MPRLQAKSLAAPDEVRELPKVHASIVNLDDATVGRTIFDPGWRWSNDLKPIVRTDSCQIHHLGYSVSGTVRIVMDDGQTLDIGPDSVYEIPAGHDAWVVGDQPWETVEWTSSRIVGVAPEGPDVRVLATILFTDIVDSTAQLHEMGDARWRDLLRALFGRFRDHLNTYRGREVKTTGDGMIAVFDSATRAVRAAAAMVRAAQELELAIRVGVHTGEVEFVGDDARGVAVHRAARVMSLAGPDEVLVSSTSADLLDGAGIDLEDAGEHQLKGLPGTRRLYRLRT